MANRFRTIGIICVSTALLLVAGCDAPQTPDETPNGTSGETPAEIPADTQAESSAPHAAILTGRGYGDIAIGMAAADTALVFDMQEEQYGCTYARLPGRDGIYFMVVEGEVARIDVADPAIRLPNGLGLGSTGADILAAYPQAEVGPNKYEYDASDYEVTLEDGLGITFMAYEDAVTAFHLGRFPEVGYVEGCS